MKKTLFIKICLVLALIVISGKIPAQTKVETTTNSGAKIQTTDMQSKENKLYFGMGFGLDYGGLGVKFELLPVKHVGLFFGGGYNFYELGWNVGGTIKLTPDKKASLNFIIMYGYNGVTVVKGASQYDMVSYGATVGANVDIKVGKKGNKFSIGFLIPFHSAEFEDNYDRIKNDPSITMVTESLPILASFGFNFAL